MTDSTRAAPTATFHARVSKGTYIRSLARDIAHALNTVGHVTMLRRTRAGPFGLEKAISLDFLAEAAKARRLIGAVLPLEAALDDIALDAADAIVVDGTSVNDPANRQVQTSFGSFQSMFAVPGPDLWLPAAGVPRGAVARHTFHSAVANDDRDYFVYTPPGYEPRRSRPYPVMFVLHGLGDDAERWMNGGAANVILDNLIAGGKAVPMEVSTLPFVPTRYYRG